MSALPVSDALGKTGAMNARQALTPEQRRYIRTIAYLAKKQGFPPTLREIGAHLGGLTAHGVKDMVGRLERHGLLTRQPNTARSIVLTEAGKAVLQ